MSCQQTVRFLYDNFMLKKNKLPKESEFPSGTEFYVFEWDVPLSKEPSTDNKMVSYFNWYGCQKRSFPVERLKVDNNWPADSNEDWLKLI